MATLSSSSAGNSSSLAQALTRPTKTTSIQSQKTHQSSGAVSFIDPDAHQSLQGFDQHQQEESPFHSPLAGRRPSLRIGVDIHDAPGAAGDGSSVSFTTREKSKDACGCLIIR